MTQTNPITDRAREAPCPTSFYLGYDAAKADLLAQLAAERAKVAELERDQEIDKEQARWQRRIDEILNRFNPGVDGSGCDSGDPLDLTATEIEMTINKVADKAVIAFAEAILHGDDEHKEWLLSAARSFVDAEPMPPVNGKGTADSLRDELSSLRESIREDESDPRHYRVLYQDANRRAGRYAEQVAELERERDEAQTELLQAEQNLAAHHRDYAECTVQNARLSWNVDSLRARLDAATALLREADGALHNAWSALDGLDYPEIVAVVSAMRHRIRSFLAPDAAKPQHGAGDGQAEQNWYVVTIEKIAELLGTKPAPAGERL